MKTCEWCGAEEKKGDVFRKSSVDCMESPEVRAYRRMVGEVSRYCVEYHRPGLRGPFIPRRVQNSIRNPVICPMCQKGLNSLARACWEIGKEKAS